MKRTRNLTLIHFMSEVTFTRHLMDIFSCKSEYSIEPVDAHSLPRNLAIHVTCFHY